ncbi:MAG: hypothetical protein B7Y80_12985 [Hyphomicrobium sp. 32-62-53]|nr:MAG: hypothetical protein B7Z29_13240 [Hyphomicrobium sp. 12-62-95]OYX98950.1 MAG: hypothetical protein B7Y80_12985 [Hyphomicrobium sp. 32-62-53]
MIAYRPEIDGLRAVAVTSVILFHAGLAGVPGGFIGVDIFFVISGFLITSIILRGLSDGTFTFLGFYERRVRRILPALFAILIVTTLFAVLWLSPVDLMDYAGSARYLAAFVSNYYFFKTSDYFGREADLQPLLHTWSLSVEEQYYLVFPPLAYLIWRYAPRVLLPVLLVILAASYGAACIKVLDNPNAAFFLVQYRIFELLAGAATAVAVHEGPLAIRPRAATALIGLLMVLLPVFLFSEETPTPGPMAMIPILGTVLLLVSATPQTQVGWLLASRPFVGIGLISYSAYLWHQPVFALARHRSLVEHPVEVFLALALLSLALAYLTWRFIEQPFRRKTFWTRPAIFRWAVVVSLAIIVFGVAAKQTAGWLGRDPSPAWLAFQASRQERDRNIPCWNALEKQGEACRLGLPNGPPTLALIGDSHAGALSDSLNNWLTREGRSGIDLNFKGCPPLLPDDGVMGACAEVRKRVFRDLADSKLPSVLIVHAAWSSLFAGPGFDNGEGGRDRTARMSRQTGLSEGVLKERIDRLSASIGVMLNAGHTVVIVDPVPEMGWQVPRQLGKAHYLNGKLQPSDASISHAAFKTRSTPAMSALGSLGAHERLIRVSPEAILCNTIAPSRCAAHHDGVALYSDDDHLSNAGARLVVERIAAELAAKGMARSSPAPETR